MSTFSQINTNIQSQNAFQNLQDTSEELATRRERLSTGLRINSAEDDAAGFQIANQLEAKTGAQDQALRNIGDAKSTLSTAEGALDSQLDILQTAKEKATQAANGSLSQSERDAIGGELKELTSELDDIQSNATFNGDQLLSGDSFVFQTGAESNSTFEVETADASTDGSTLNLAGDINLAGSAGDGVSLDAGDFEGGGNNSLDSFTVPSDLSAEDLDASDPGDQIDASLDGSGNLAGDLNGGKFNVTVTNAENDTGPTPSELNLEFDVEGREGTQVVNVNDAQDSAVTLEADGSGNKIRLDADQLFDDGAVQANESKDFSVTVKDQNDIGARLEGGSANNAKAIIDDVDTAIDNVSSELSDLGAAQNRLSFKESNLETSKTNLESAQSRIEDADFAKEQTQVAKLQVQQQSGTAQLAQANSAGQSVLSLLR